jgi:polyhydroxyalkanoate synthesis regulator phasin
MQQYWSQAQLRNAEWTQITSIKSLTKSINMEENIEMDITILKKNLEITKLTQQIDSLRSMVVDLEEKLKTLTSINDNKSEIIESLTKHK